MAEPQPDNAASPPPPGRDQELASARQVFRDLDKSWRATRTYGIDNAVTRRFFDQLRAAMIAHLEEWPVLAVIVERAELRLYGEVVYGSEDSLGESLAFRLFGDGVREVRFEVGVSPEDLHGFLDALWGHEGEEDDDIVTRFWAKNLATISFVTAEDILQAPTSSELTPQEHGFFSAPPSSFGQVLDREKRLAASAPAASGLGPPAAGENLAKGQRLLGFELTAGDRSMLEHDLAAERALDGNAVVLSMLQAILVSDRSPVVLMRALSVMPSVMDALLAAGNWPALVQVLALLETAPDANAAFGAMERTMAEHVLNSLNSPKRVALIGAGLNSQTERSLAGLAGVFARLNAEAVEPLCAVLATLDDEEHRAALRDALIRLGIESPEPVLKGLADRRPQYVLDLIRVIAAWQQPQAADVLAMVAHHPAPEVRAEALASIARLRARGDGAPILAFVSDGEREVRLQAVRLLASGRYSASWEVWRPHLKDSEAVIEEARADKRVLFHALRVTAGDGAVPFWRSLLEPRGWKQRQQREETALLVVKELAALGTDRARDALDFGKREAAGAVRKACAAALAAGGKS